MAHLRGGTRRRRRSARSPDRSVTQRCVVGTKTCRPPTSAVVRAVGSARIRCPAWTPLAWTPIRFRSPTPKHRWGSECGPIPDPHLFSFEQAVPFGARHLPQSGCGDKPARAGSSHLPLPCSGRGTCRVPPVEDSDRGPSDCFGQRGPTKTHEIMRELLAAVLAARLASTRIPRGQPAQGPRRRLPAWLATRPVHMDHRQRQSNLPFPAPTS